jgi:hypothetical protein
VFVATTHVAVGGTGVNVAVGGTGVSVGRGVASDGAGVGCGSSGGISVAGCGPSGGSSVVGCGSGVRVGTVWRCGFWPGAAHMPGLGERVTRAATVRITRPGQARKCRNRFITILLSQGDVASAKRKVNTSFRSVDRSKV